jgi:hypothetical protein
MAMKGIIDRIKTLELQEIRRLTEEYCELVIFNEHMDQCVRILTDSLGPPFKSAGEKTTDDMLSLTEDYGEIVDHQTLFVKQLEDAKIIAMLWPWQDETRTTLIMGHIG